MKTQLSNKFKFITTFGIFIGLGVLSGDIATEYWPALKQQLFSPPDVYMTSNKRLINKHANASVRAIGWGSLLPEKEYKVINHYQNKQGQSLKDMTSQILRSIKASTDKSYQDALISTNTVNSIKDQMVSISGFIVPIDFHQNNSVKSLFFVPYFGACLHFPPPPPNQIIYAQLEEGFGDMDITQAYTLTGEISLDLFEDPLGTSAYVMDVVSISEFHGSPDDFRQH